MVDSSIRLPRLNASGKIDARFLPTLSAPGVLFAKDYVANLVDLGQRTQALQRAMTDAATQGLDLCFDNLPGSTLGVPFAINAVLDTPAGLRSYASGRASIRQTVRGLAVFRAAVPGFTFEGIQTVGDGLDIGPLGSYDATAFYAGFLIEPGSSGWRILRCGAKDYHRGISFRGSSTQLMSNVEINDFDVDRCTFGIFGREMANVTIAGVRGTYQAYTSSNSTIDLDNPPHLVYLTGYDTISATEYRPRNRNVRVVDCAARDSVGGHAYALKGISGLYYNNLSADNCSGVLDLIGIYDSTTGSYASTNDLYPYSGDRASVAIKNSRRVDLGSGTVVFAPGDHGRSYFAEGGNIRVRNFRMKVVTNATVERATLSADFQRSTIRLASDAAEMIEPDVTALGAKTHSAIFIVSTGSRQRVQHPSIGPGFTVGVLVDKKLSGVVVEYDPSQIAADSAVRVYEPGALPTVLPRLVNSRRGLYPGDSEAVTAWLDPEVISLSGDTLNEVWHSGQAPATVSGTWQVQADGYSETTNAPLAVNAAPLGTSNVEASLGIRFGAETEQAGVALRVATPNVQLAVVLDASNRILLTSRNSEADSANPAILAQAATPVTPGRLYQLRTVTAGRLVQVFLDGALTISYEMAPDQANPTAAGTSHGVYTRRGSSTRFYRATFRRLD